MIFLPCTRYQNPIKQNLSISSRVALHDKHRPHIHVCRKELVHLESDNIACTLNRDNSWASILPLSVRVLAPAAMVFCIFGICINIC